MGLYREQVLPRLVDKVLDNSATARLRERCVVGLTGVVVEPGFGSGLNAAHYPDAVTKVYAIEPAKLGQSLAADRVRARGVPVEFVGTDGQRIPLPSNSCDSALLTFTLCTIADHEAALSELRRVLVPGGSLHFLEHGQSPDQKTAAWQRRIEPIQKVVAAGCHLTRHMPTLIAAAGFEIAAVDEFYVPGPRPFSYYYLGRAVSPR